MKHITGKITAAVCKQIGLGDLRSLYNLDSEIRDILGGKAKGHSFAYIKNIKSTETADIYVYESKDWNSEWRWEITLSGVAWDWLLRTHRTEKVISACLAVRKTFTIPSDEYIYWENPTEEQIKERSERAIALWNQRVKTLQESLETIAAEVKAARAEVHGTDIN